MILNMPINPSHLRTFHAVAREGGFSKAARALGVSQPTLSLQVQALEARYGVKLFERRGRRVELTDIGIQLVEITGPLFANLDEAEDLLAGGYNLSGGYLLLGATGPYQIVPLMKAFRERYPEPRLSLFVRNGAELMTALRNRQIDIAVHSDPPLDQKGLGLIPLQRDPAVVCVGLDHAWANRKSIPMRDLATQTLVLREKGTVTRDTLDRAFREAGIDLAPIMEINDWESVRELVAAGLGVTVMSLPDTGFSKRIVRIPLRDPNLEISEYLVFHTERRRLRTVRAFLDLAEEMIAEPEK